MTRDLKVEGRAEEEEDSSCVFPDCCFLPNEVAELDGDDGGESKSSSDERIIFGSFGFFSRFWLLLSVEEVIVVTEEDDDEVANQKITTETTIATISKRFRLDPIYIFFMFFLNFCKALCFFDHDWKNERKDFLKNIFGYFFSVCLQKQETNKTRDFFFVEIFFFDVFSSMNER
jgi:hypothetical protein